MRSKYISFETRSKRGENVLSEKDLKDLDTNVFCLGSKEE